MGVPKFYRWLSERYPLINQAIDETTLLPEFDNLYLDMNGIIHNATHGNDGVSKRLSEKDVVLTMMAYIDNMVKIIKPRKLLYMAIDGVAPRAKMNQQRSRRFRAARDLAQARKEAASRGEAMEDEDVFDSNCITPGTEFMDTLGKHMVYFIRKKIKEDPMWQRMKVIFSGHDVPGEGEHKIVQYIRGAKLRPDWDPNTRHCMAGLDADLIMLSLATHEPHFSLLREQVDFKAFKKNPFGTKTKTRVTSAVKWQLLHVGILREYLEVDMKPHHALPPSFDNGRGFDGERIVDDFVLIMALCGNDFTPHLPSLDIGEGAIDHLLRVYREQLGAWGGYLSTEGLIHWDRVEKLLAVMGAMEADIFKARAEEAEQMARRAKRDAKRNASMLGYDAAEDGDGGDDDDAEAAADEITNQARAAAEQEMLNAVALRLAQEKRDAAKAGHPLPSPAHSAAAASEASGVSETNDVPGAMDDEEDLVIVPFSLHDGDFKGRYYLDKFGITYKRGSAQDDAVLEKIVRSFVEALQWVMLYYYRGVPSWGWFYPFHFAPMTSDLERLTRFDLSFRLGQPFKPFQQLLGCLPAASGKFLPEPYRRLMTDDDSPLLEFYPAVEHIKVDMNGKRNSWEGVTLIPFIREGAMLEAIASRGVDAALTTTEAKRNSFGVEFLFWHDPSALDTVHSINADLFQPIQLCQSRMIVYQSPRLPVLTVGGPSALGKGSDGQQELMDLEKDPEKDNVIRVSAGMAGSSKLFSCRPRPGCTIPAPGFPTLHSLPFTPMLKPCHMDVFGMKSRKDSIILAISNGRAFSEEEEEEQEDSAMLAAAGAFAAGGAAAGAGDSAAGGAPGGDGDDGKAAHKRVFSGTPAHVPTFSVAYAKGTSVADGPDAVARDVLSTWTGKAYAAAGSRHMPKPTARAVAEQLLGRTMYAEWPHLREVLVVAVCDGLEEATWHANTSSYGDDKSGPGQGSISFKALNVDDQVTYERTAEDLRRSVLGGGRGLNIAGVKVGDVKLVVTVRRLEGMRRDPSTGALTRVFSTAGSPGEIRTLPQLLLEQHPMPDPRFQEQGAATPAVRFPTGCPVLAIRGSTRGALAKVTGYVKATSEEASDGKSLDDRLVIEAEVPPPEAPFGITIHQTISDRYFDARSAAQALRISPQTLGRITGSVIVLPKKWDVGLNLKVHRTLFLAGYVRNTGQEAQNPAWASGADSRAIAASGPTPGGGGYWEYTERAIALVAAYQKAFPAVFGLLESMPHETAYDVRDFPGKGDAVVKVCTWLQQLETAKRPLVPITTQVMSLSAVTAVQKAAEAFNLSCIKRAASMAGITDLADPSIKVTKTETVRGVAVSDVFRQEEQAYAVGGIGEGEGIALASLNVDGPDCIPKLGDRVSNLSFKAAPLGLRGTVVAIHAASGYVEVVFDKEFVGGTTLGGLCSNGRGGLVPWSAVLLVGRAPTDSVPGPARVGTVAGLSGAGRRADAAASAAGSGYERDDFGPRGKQGRGGRGYGGDDRPRAAAPAPAPYPMPSAAGGMAADVGPSAAKVHAHGRIAAGPGGAGFGGRGGRAGPTAAAAPAPAPAQVAAPQQAYQQQQQAAGGRPATAGAGGGRGGHGGHGTGRGGAAAGASSAAAPAPAPAAAGATPAAICQQVEFYFSDSNLSTDKFMRQQFGKDATGMGWVDVAVLASFNRLKTMAGGSVPAIATAVAQNSTALMVNPDGTKIRRAVAWRPTPGGGNTPKPQPQAAPAPAAAQVPVLAPQQAAPVNTSGLTPSVAALFAAPAPAAARPAQAAYAAQPQPAMQAGPAPVTGGSVLQPGEQLDMATYWRRLMAQPQAAPQAQAAPAGLLQPTAGGQAPAQAAAAPAGGQATSAFDQLLQDLQRSRLGQ